MVHAMGLWTQFIAEHFPTLSVTCDSCYSRFSVSTVKFAVAGLSAVVLSSDSIQMEHTNKCGL